MFLPYIQVAECVPLLTRTDVPTAYIILLSPTSELLLGTLVFQSPVTFARGGDNEELLLALLTQDFEIYYFYNPF